VEQSEVCGSCGTSFRTLGLTGGTIRMGDRVSRCLPGQSARGGAVED
jgi:hypothetical protein